MNSEDESLDLLSPREIFIMTSGIQPNTPLIEGAEFVFRYNGYRTTTLYQHEVFAVHIESPEFQYSFVIKSREKFSVWGQIIPLTLDVIDNYSLRVASQQKIAMIEEGIYHVH